MPRSCLAVAGLVVLAFAPLASAADAPTDKVVAVVNGTQITQSAYDRYLETRSGETPQDSKTIMEEIITREIVLQDALKREIDKRPDVVRELAMQRENLLVAAGLKSHIDAYPINDEELRKLYDQRLKDMTPKELHARHILVPTEEEAKGIIAQLDKGADFAALAKEKSKDNSAEQGGDLGWFNPTQMVQPFALAALGLAKGKYTSKPVQSEFGWHIILLEDTRTAEPPSFDQTKERLRLALQRVKLQEYIRELRSQAKVENP